MHKLADWILLEVNARPWGSMPLPVALGLDFPYWWYRLLVEKFEISPRAYRAGRYGRNLLPDLRYLLSSAESLRRLPAEAGKIPARKHGGIWPHSSRPGISRHAHRRRWRARLGGNPWMVPRAVFTRRCPGPARWLGRTARGIARFCAIAPDARRPGTNAPSLFSCCQTCNICRSPFAAELLLRQLLHKIKSPFASARSAICREQTRFPHRTRSRWRPPLVWICTNHRSSSILKNRQRTMPA